MIGNTIKFFIIKYDSDHNSYKETFTGLVVDAFTEVKGNIKGSSSGALSFSSGSVSGTTDSNRIYKVQYKTYDGGNTYFINIRDWQLDEIIAFAGQTKKETNEEKFKFG